MKTLVALELFERDDAIEVEGREAVLLARAEVAAAAGSTLDAAFVKTYEENLARAARTGNNEAQAKIHDLHASYVQMDAAKFVEVLRPLIGTNFTTLKHRWLHSEATTGALLIMDEAHVAAGDASLRRR